MPKRVRLSRKRGARKPDGVIYVGRPTKWGNPYRVVKRDGTSWVVIGHGKLTSAFDVDQPWTHAEAVAEAVERFRQMFAPGTSYALRAREELAGHDLACWCPLDSPCHADVLLSLAAGGDGSCPPPST